MNEITITILFKNNQVKGILGPNTSSPNSKWWDNQITIPVPILDWESEKVTVSTIQHYLRQTGY